MWIIIYYFLKPFFVLFILHCLHTISFLFPEEQLLREVPLSHIEIVQLGRLYPVSRIAQVLMWSKVWRLMQDGGEFKAHLSDIDKVQGQFRGHKQTLSFKNCYQIVTLFLSWEIS